VKRLSYKEDARCPRVKRRVLRERDHLEDVGVDGRTILKMDLQDVGLGSMEEI